MWKVKMNSRTNLIVSISFILFCCEKKTSDLTKYLEQVHHCNKVCKYTALIFLPQNSCSGCLSKILDFLNNQERIPDSMQIIIAGYNMPEIKELQRRLKVRRNAYFIDLKYQYVQYEIFDANTAFWIKYNEDNSTKLYTLDANTLDINLFALQKEMEQTR